MQPKKTLELWAAFSRKNTPTTVPLLHHFTSSEQFTPNSYIFSPPWQLNSYIVLSPQSYIVLAPILEDCQSRTHSPSTLSWFSLKFRPSKLDQLLTLCIYEYKLLELPLSTKYPLTLTTFYPLKKTTSIFLNYFITLGSPDLCSFYPLWTNNPQLIHHFNPLTSSNFTSFYLLWTNYPLPLLPFCSLCQLNSYIILHPLNTLPHSYNTLPSWQLSSYRNWTPLNKLPTKSYTFLSALAAQQI